MGMKILALVGAILLMFLLWQGIRANPALFSKANLNKSFTSMGVLALILTAFVAFCSLLLRSGA